MSSKEGVAESLRAVAKVLEAVAMCVDSGELVYEGGSMEIVTDRKSTEWQLLSDIKLKAPT